MTYVLLSALDTTIGEYKCVTVTVEVAFFILFIFPFPLTLSNFHTRF